MPIQLASRPKVDNFELQRWIFNLWQLKHRRQHSKTRNCYHRSTQADNYFNQPRRNWGEVFSAAYAAYAVNTNMAQPRWYQHVYN